MISSKYFYSRRIGRWLSNIRPVIPLFNSDRCTFVMKTVPWAMPWKPSLSIRLAGKSDGKSSFICFSTNYGIDLVDSRVPDLFLIIFQRGVGVFKAYS